MSDQHFRSHVHRGTPRSRSQDEETEAREDIEGYCPRIDGEVLVLSGCCFHRERPWSCWGCVFDRNFVHVKLTILLKELLESRGRSGESP